MSVEAADLQLYGTANMPEDDTSTTGGAIDLSIKVVFVPLGAADTINVVSDDALDTDQTYDVHGYSVAGAKITEGFAIAGLTPDSGGTTFERITKIVQTAGAALVGTLTWERNTGPVTIVTMESAADSAAGTEIDEIRTIYFNAASDPDSAKILYDKVFMRNNDGTITLTEAAIRLMDGCEDTTYATTVDVDSAAGQKVLSVAATAGAIAGDSIIINVGGVRAEIHEINTVQAGVSLTLIDNLIYAHTLAQADAVNLCKAEFWLETSLDGTTSVANRTTAPGGSTFNARTKNVANTQNHTAGTAQAVWIKLSLGAGDAPQKTEVEVRESGNTV